MNMNEAFRTDVVDGLIGVAYYEEDASNPQKDWDPFGEILYAKRSRYVLGGRAVDSDEMREIAEDPNNIVLPVYAYVHGGSTISTGAFSCQWDSGQSGYVWISKADALSQLGKKRLTTKTREKILENLRGTVRTFAMFLEGDVYDLRVYRVDENGDIDESDIVDSMGDVYERDYAEKELEKMVQREAANERKRVAEEAARVEAAADAKQERFEFARGASD
jgi:hypothetical protein